MENATYATLTRQTGLMAQMRVVANNIANADTTGFRGEALVFSEVVRSTGSGESLSMATARVHQTVMTQGSLAATGGAFDLAIEGEGFFMVQTPQGPRLTRAGQFGPDAGGGLVTPEGYPVLDAGGAPVLLPPGAAGIAPDGTISVDGAPVGQVGLFVPRDPLGLVREGGTRFRADAGADPAPGARMLQGFLEGSNVEPVLEVARMIEVSRAYEMGQGFLESEDDRIRKTIQALTVK